MKHVLLAIAPAAMMLTSCPSDPIDVTSPLNETPSATPSATPTPTHTATQTATHTPTTTLDITPEECDPYSTPIIVTIEAMEPTEWAIVF